MMEGKYFESKCTNIVLLNKGEGVQNFDLNLMNVFDYFQKKQKLIKHDV